ncbi:P-loop containing nucleoside triphosphate hydrolase protein [Gongronella butleri]|nr:P-loop containing nucleoside triphosphate hydrolase protein [Gongronella butleri]
MGKPVPRLWSSSSATLLGNQLQEPQPMSPPTTPLFASPLPISPTSTPSPSSSLNSQPPRPSSVTQTRPAKSENIQVMVRCRPLKDTEDESCWQIDANSIQLDDSLANAFEYDKIFQGSNNDQVYKSGIQELVRSSMDGYNGTVFAYGQTASGKTYTMGTEQEPGIIPKAIQDVFLYIEEVGVNREFLLQVSYLEIYNERINDLLNPDAAAAPLEIRSVHKRLQDVVVEGLIQVPVTTPEDIMHYIRLGEEKRHTSDTDFNLNSSRSHTIFQLMIESRSRTASAHTFVRLSKLNLIDLAGSEKVASMQERRQEGAHINRSLLTLGKVINSLIQGSAHVPYRESKLTRILQPSLSGNAHVAVICAINPARPSKDESMNTLRFAQGVKKIKTVPKITQVTHHSQLQNYKDQILELESLMQRKTEQEAEAKERLSHLLGLILTSSKTSTDASLSGDGVQPDWMNDSMGDVVSQCEQQLTMTMSKYQEDYDEKVVELQRVTRELAKTRSDLQEKSALINELQDAITESQRLQDAQERKAKADVGRLNDRWAELEVILTDYKQRLVSSEARVIFLEAQHEADVDAREKLEKQVEEITKASLLVQSLDDLDSQAASSTVALNGTDAMDAMDPVASKSATTSDNSSDSHVRVSASPDLQRQLAELQDRVQELHVQLTKRDLAMDELQERHRYELQKERDRTLIYKQKLEKVPQKISQLEEALNKLRATHDQGAAAVSPSFASSSDSSDASGDVDSRALQGLYLQNGSWILLVAFGCWLFG